MADKPLFVRTWLVLLLGFIGIILIYEVFVFDADSTANSHKFSHLPEFALWLLLLGAQAVFFFIMIIPVWKEVLALKRAYDLGNPIEFCGSLLLFTFLFSLPSLLRYRLNITWPLVGHEWKILIVIVFGFIISILSVIGILLINRAFQKLSAEPEIKDDHIQLYCSLRSKLQFFLTVAGTLIGLATLGTGALRKTMVAFDEHNEVSFSSAIILAYGLYYTLVLALVYAPVYSCISQTGQVLLDKFFPQLLPKDEHWSERNSRRKEFEEYLQLGLGTEQNFQSHIAILAPLLSGIVSLLINK